jgi:hypothetical protein
MTTNHSRGRTNGVHRFNVNFSEGAWRDLTALAESKEKSVADVLRDAIALERWFWDQIDAGHKVLIERRDGSIAEVVPR